MQNIQNDSFNYQRTETTPDNNTDRFSLFNKSRNKPSRLDPTHLRLNSINRISLRSDRADPFDYFRKKRQTSNTRRKTIHNTSFKSTSYSRNVNPFQTCAASSSIAQYAKSDNMNEPPQHMIECINIENETNEIELLFKNIKTTITQINCSNKELKHKREEYISLENELHKAKEMRNKIFEELYHMKNDIEYQRNSIMTESVDRNGLYDNYSTYNPSTQMYLPTITNTNSNQDISEKINLYEDKICKLKTDNQQLFEDFDNYSFEIKQYEKQNDKLKKKLIEIEKRIQKVMKDKTALKAQINKMH